jgi:hypothetical protein
MHKCLFALHLKGIAKIAGMVIMLLSIGKPKFKGPSGGVFFRRIFNGINDTGTKWN